MRVRGREEIEGSLQAFKDVYEAQFGKKLSLGAVQSMAYMLLDEKEQEILRQRFFDFHPKDLQTLIEMCREIIDRTASSPEISPKIESKTRSKVKK